MRELVSKASYFFPEIFSKVISFHLMATNVIIPRILSVFWMVLTMLWKLFPKPEMNCVFPLKSVSALLPKAYEACHSQSPGSFPSPISRYLASLHCRQNGKHSCAQNTCPYCVSAYEPTLLTNWHCPFPCLGNPCIMTPLECGTR